MASPEDCRAYKAETFRLQEERNLPLPYFDAGFDVKHDPYIVLNGTVGKVLVGKGAVTGHFEDPIHPMEDDRGTPSTTSKRFGWKIRTEIFFP